MNVLVTGFGSFPGVEDNPTAALATALDGQRAGAASIIGRVLPVSYRRGPAEAVRLALEHDVVMVLGFGVANSREQVEVECRAVRVSSGLPDVDGKTDTGLTGPNEVFATIDLEKLAEALYARPSSDAGEYVCNAWLYTVASALSVPVGFVHVPAAGLPPERARAAITRLLGAPRLT